MECYKDSPKETGDRKATPIENALNDLQNGIRIVKETMVKFESTLASVITSPEQSPETTEKEKGQTRLENLLISMNDDVAEIDTYLRGIQNRIQL